MKSLLSISLLSVLLSLCNSREPKEPEKIDVPVASEQTVSQSPDAPVIDGAEDSGPAPAPTVEKPAHKGEMPDTAARKIIEHGAPDKARNDSVKAAKTKGKF